MDERSKYDEKEYWKAVSQWKKAKEKADVVMDRMSSQPGADIYLYF